MKHKLLSLVVISAGISMVACSDDKGGGGYAGPQTCAINPTLSGCSLQKAALAQVPGSPEQIAALKAGVTPPGAPAPYDPGKQVPGGTEGTKRTLSVSDKAIRQQAAKVMAALEADKHNPDSPYYVPPVEENPVAASTGRSPSSIQAASVPEVQLGAPMVQGGGEAAQ